MSLFKPILSKQERKSGRFYIFAIVPDEASPESFGERLDRAEAAFKEQLTKVIEDSLRLKKSTKREGTIETLELYETPEGVIVEVVRDQFEGLMVESEDKAIIEKIYQELSLK